MSGVPVARAWASIVRPYYRVAGTPRLTGADPHEAAKPRSARARSAAPFGGAAFAT